MKHSITRNENHNEREEKLIEGIVELVSVFQPINQNELKIKVVDEEDLGNKNSFVKKLKILVDDGIIEEKKGTRGQETIYYISGLGNAHKEIYDNKFAKEIIELEEVISQIKLSYTDFEEQTMEQALGILNQIRQQCSMVMSWYKEQNQIFNKLDSTIEEIKNYDIDYPHELIQSYVNDAIKIYESLKNSEKEKSFIIKQIMNSKSPSSRTNKIKKLIENRRNHKKLSTDIQKILEDMPHQKEVMQEQVFRQVIDSLDEQLHRKIPYSKVEILRKLHLTHNGLPKLERNWIESFQSIIDSSEEPQKTKLNEKLSYIRKTSQMSSELVRMISDAINVLEKENRRPIKESTLVKKLVETKFFTKSDARNVISGMEFEGIIYRSNEGIYRIRKW